MYNYKSKYYVQGNIRRDGSSRFAPDCRWGTPSSASAGWVFTEEKFMEGARKVLDHGKLRPPTASWATSASRATTPIRPCWPTITRWAT